MFEPCIHNDNRICAFSGHDSKGINYCGFATSNNIINEMKKCPLIDIKKKKLEKKKVFKGNAFS